MTQNASTALEANSSKNQTQYVAAENNADQQNIAATNITPPNALAEKYEFIEKLGKGSQGQVWLAKRLSDGEKVAIKQLHVYSVTTWKQYELFKREADILAQLNIDGVVPFYEYIEMFDVNPPYVCIVQKFIEGRTLADMLATKQRFEKEAIYDIIAQTLTILQNLHEHEPQVIHRDIKPSNLMLTALENGKFKVTLLDFGAVANPQVQNGGSTVAGTFGYMPPEQLMGRALPGSDIYALAAVAVQMLSGVSPADIDVVDFKLVIEPHLSNLDIDVVNTLNAMLEPTLENRFCIHSELIAYFKQLAEQQKASFLNILRRNRLPNIEDIAFIGQPGNYELWQVFESGKTEIDFQKIIEKHKKQGKTHQINIQNSTIAGIVVAVICIVLAVLAALILNNIIVALCALPIAGFVAYCLIRSSIKDKKNKQEMRELLNELDRSHYNHLDQQEDWQPLTNMMDSTQKIVGKITYIDYICAASDNVITSKEMNRLFVTVQGKPCFRVGYRFNLKHNDKTYTFNAEAITLLSPEHRYKVGDPITLLADFVELSEATTEKLDKEEAQSFYAESSARNNAKYLEMMGVKDHNKDDDGEAELEALSNAMMGIITMDAEPDNNATISSANQTVLQGSVPTKRYQLRVMPYPFPYVDATDIKQIIFEMQFGKYIELKCEQSKYAKLAIKCAEMMQSKGNHVACDRYFQQAICLGGGNEMIAYGDYLWKRSKFKSAYWYKKAYVLGNMEGGHRLIRFFESENMFEEYEFWSIQLFNRGDMKVAYTLAEVCARNNKNEKAIELYKLMFERGEVKAAILLADIYASLGNKDLAMVWGNKVVESRKIDDMYQLAEVFIARRMISSAVELYTKLFNAKNDEAGIRLVDLYLNERMEKHFNDWFNKLKEHNHPETSEKLIELLMTHKRSRHALEVCKYRIQHGDANSKVKIIEILLKSNGQTEEIQFWVDEICSENVKNVDTRKIKNLINLFTENRRSKFIVPLYTALYQHGDAQAAAALVDYYVGINNIEEASKWCLNATNVAGAGFAIQEAYNCNLFDPEYRRHETTKKLLWLKCGAQHGEISVAGEIAEIYQELGNEIEAEKWFMVAIENGYTSVGSDFIERYIDRGDINTAIRFVESILKNEENAAKNRCALVKKLADACDARTLLKKAEELRNHIMEFDPSVVLSNAEMFERRNDMRNAIKYYDMYYTNHNIEMLKLVKLAEKCRDYDLLEETKKCYVKVFNAANLNDPVATAEKYTKEKNFQELVEQCETRFADGFIIVSKLLAALHKTEKSGYEIALLWDSINIIKDRREKIVVKIAKYWTDKGEYQKAKKWVDYSMKFGEKIGADEILRKYLNLEKPIYDDDLTRWFEKQRKFTTIEAKMEIANYYKLMHKYRSALRWYESAYRLGCKDAVEAIVRTYAIEMRDEAQTLRWYRIMNEHDASACAKTFDDIRKELSIKIHNKIKTNIANE